MKFLLFFGIACFALMGCGRERWSNYVHEVEIAPGKWLTLKEERGKCWFICEWNGKPVQWDGKRNRYGENELPVTLREHEGNLYMIVFNREDMDAFRYVYFKLGKKGTAFVEIAPNEFPKRIATQNMWLNPRDRMRRVGSELIDSWEMLRKLDVESNLFYQEHTGEIWIQLETGKNYREVRYMDYELKKRIIREYATKYKPIPLPTLVKEK